MKIDYYEEIKARYGNVRRAKSYYLYTEKNIRLLDLYLDAGMSLLGRRMNQSPLIFKQFIDKGLLGFLPSQADYNLEKSLNMLFPSHSDFRLYTSEFACFEALKLCGIISSAEEYKFEEYKRLERELLWRPFLPDSESLTKNKAFLVQPAICSAYKILVFQKDETLDLPVSDFMPATEKAALARAFFDLQKKQTEYKKTENLNDEAYLRFTSTKRQRKQAESSLRQYNEVLELASKFWDIKGAYLFPKMTEDEYKSFFLKALDAHILLSPDFYQASFLPRLQNYTELLNFLKTN